MCSRDALLLLCSLLVFSGHRCEENATAAATTEENALAKLVKMFSKPGAFKRVRTLCNEQKFREIGVSYRHKGNGCITSPLETRRSVSSGN